MKQEDNIIHLTLTERIQWLVNDVNSAKERSVIRIVGGEADSTVYGNKEVTEAFRRAKTREVEIRMLIGPVILIDEEERKNRIVDLYNEGVLRLFYRPSRHEILHYRIIDKADGKNVYVEAPHEPLQDSKDHKVIKLEHVAFWAEKLSEDFDHLISSGRVKETTNPKDDFVFLSPLEIIGLIEKLHHSGKDYDFLSKEEIMTYLNG